MKSMSVTEKIKSVLDSKIHGIEARLFVSRDDGITLYDSTRDHTTSSVAALISGLWQASEAVMGMVKKDHSVMNFRLGFDTSSDGIYLLPFEAAGQKYFLGAIYQGCLNPGLLKRQVTLIKDEMDVLLAHELQIRPIKKDSQNREGFLFREITDEEIDRLFSVGGI